MLNLQNLLALIYVVNVLLSTLFAVTGITLPQLVRVVLYYLVLFSPAGLSWLAISTSFWYWFLVPAGIYISYMAVLMAQKGTVRGSKVSYRGYLLLASQVVIIVSLLVF